MTRRDLRWRIGGVALIAAGYAVTRAASNATGSADIPGLFGLLVAAGGLLLLLGGKRVALALRIERSRHRELPGAIHVARQTRRRGKHHPL